MHGRETAEPAAARSEADRPRPTGNPRSKSAAAVLEGHAIILPNDTAEQLAYKVWYYEAKARA